MRITIVALLVAAIIGVAINLGLMDGLRQAISETVADLRNGTISNHTYGELQPDLACFFHAKQIDDVSACLVKLDRTVQLDLEVFHQLQHKAQCFDSITLDGESNGPKTAIACAEPIIDHPTALFVCTTMATKWIGGCFRTESALDAERCLVQRAEQVMAACDTIPNFSFSHNSFSVVLKLIGTTLNQAGNTTYVSPLVKAVACAACSRVPEGILREDCLHLCNAGTIPELTGKSSRETVPKSV